MDTTGARPLRLFEPEDILMDRDVELGNKIAQWRFAKVVPLGVLAYHLAISRRRLSEWERTGVPMFEAQIVRLAMRQVERDLMPTPTEF